MKAMFGGPVVCLLLSALCLGASELQTFEGCTYVPTEWADGDSFRVRFPKGDEHTVRLYGVDCFETRAKTDTDARRVRAQRRYFGFSGDPKDAQKSIAQAKAFGQDGKGATARALAKPFTVRTGFADGRGDGAHKRIYGFVETAGGKDLAELLVSEGIARAYGVYRRKSDDVTADEYRDHLSDLELAAAKMGRGAWALTDWEKLPAERRLERKDEEGLAAAKEGPKLPPSFVDPNTASRDLLMELPGVGEATANRIIESREEGAYRSAADLRRVHGIGAATVEKLAPYLKFEK